VSFPHNAVEETLAAAQAGQVAGDHVIAALADADLWVPLPQGATDTQGALPIMIIDEVKHVAVYTSEEQFKRCAGAMSYAVAPGRAFVQTLPPELGLAVNPGGEGGLPIPPAALQAMRGDEGMAAAGTRVMLGEPAEEPHDLLDALRAAFAAAAPAVATARRAWGKVGAYPEGLLLGVETTPDDDRSHQSALDAVDTALQRSPVPFGVDTVFLDAELPADEDPLSAWFLAHTRPFYTRPHGTEPAEQQPEG
jgi:hypothetical protein